MRVSNDSYVSKDDTKSQSVILSEAEFCLFANICLARTSRLIELSPLLMCIRALFHFAPSLS